MPLGAGDLGHLQADALGELGDVIRGVRHPKLIYADRDGVDLRDLGQTRVYVRVYVGYIAGVLGVLGVLIRHPLPPARSRLARKC
jgi:hypothetical protein